MDLQEEGMDGFDHYPTDLSIGGYGVSALWLGAAGDVYSWDLVAGLSGPGQALRSTGTSASSRAIRRAVLECEKFAVSFAIRPDGVDNVTTKFFALLTADLLPIVYIAMTPLATLRLMNSAGGTLMNGATTIAIGSRQHFSIFCDLTGGPGNEIFQLRLNGDDENLEFDYTGNLRLGTSLGKKIAAMQLPNGTNGGGSGLPAAWDDFYWRCNIPTGLMPEVEVYTDGPTADVLAEWTRLSGSTNTDMVDEDKVDGDTTYNHTDVPGEMDIFEFADLPFEPEEVICVCLALVTRKEESATRAVVPVVRMGGTDYLGDNYYNQNTYTWAFKFDQLNPNGDIPWTKAALDAYQGGYQYVDLDALP